MPYSSFFRRELVLNSFLLSSIQAADNNTDPNSKKLSASAARRDILFPRKRRVTFPTIVSIAISLYGINFEVFERGPFMKINVGKVFVAILLMPFLAMELASCGGGSNGSGGG